jgi:6-phosphofructokinase 1
MANPIKRIGVLSGGGDCPGINAVIRAVVKSAILRWNLEVFGIEDGFLGLIENRMSPLSEAGVSNILTLGGTILGSSNRSDPQSYPVERDGKTVFVDMTDQVMENIRRNALDAVVAIGGDGTMTVAANLIRKGARFIGVPKTIDNDFVGCDVTFGFDTAVTTATECLDKLHTTACSHHRVMVVEVMGRNAGWLALYAGVASGSDVILIPEIEYDFEKVCEALMERNRRGKGFSIICVSEGAKPKGGQVVIQRIVEGSPERVRLGGIATRLATEIEDRTGLETRSVILGHLQRGGTPTPMDRVLATNYGSRAMEIMMEGRFGKVVVWRGGKLDEVDIESVAGKQRKVPLDYPLLHAARVLGTRFGD